MGEWPDAKIRSTALWYIGKSSMDPQTWQYTLIGDAHPEVSGRVDLQSGESTLVSFFLMADCWYLFTTRRVVGAHAGHLVCAAALDVAEDRFGNFKGYGGVGLEVMHLRLTDGAEATLQYETGLASMAPIYYFRYWRIKYPILDKLRAEPLYGPPTRETPKPPNGLDGRSSARQSRS